MVTNTWPLTSKQINIACTDFDNSSYNINDYLNLNDTKIFVFATYNKLKWIFMQ